jgi:hypothetical protein
MGHLRQDTASGCNDGSQRIPKPKQKNADVYRSAKEELEQFARGVRQGEGGRETPQLIRTHSCEVLYWWAAGMTGTDVK